ncbi:hypothetical protein L3X38_043075 [Prunus dulcis]|uniref:Uncharacterized protein n=1 Tax=Prunus dulcis TaxID=3755 RepID=A0AAD4YM53_PRUDU|nr:hypothetical protein L3X38_043075 [Prunus dulcis]
MLYTYWISSIKLVIMSMWTQVIKTIQKKVRQAQIGTVQLHFSCGCGGIQNGQVSVRVRDKGDVTSNEHGWPTTTLRGPS